MKALDTALNVFYRHELNEGMGSHVKFIARVRYYFYCHHKNGQNGSIAIVSVIHTVTIGTMVNNNGDGLKTLGVNRPKMFVAGKI